MNYNIILIDQYFENYQKLNLYLNFISNHLITFFYHLLMEWNFMMFNSLLYLPVFIYLFSLFLNYLKFLIFVFNLTTFNIYFKIFSILKILFKKFIKI